MTTAMVFPGQGSQSPGMQADLAAEFPEVSAAYDEAAEVLGYDLWSVIQEGPAERLGETTVTQPAMLTAGYAAWQCWKSAGGADPAQLAGHSLGEYTALACSGAVSFPDALRVVQQRAELMQQAVPTGVGAMAAILGLADEVVIDACARAAEGEVVEAVNFNAPGQVVIAGHRTAVDRAIALAQEAGARRALLLPVSVPAHSALMHPAGDELRAALAEADFMSPAITVLGASDATPYGDGDDIRERLALQVHSPVQWVRTVSGMIGNGATAIIECGPGKVLAGLVRRIDRNVDVGTLDGMDGLQEALSE